MKRGLLALVLGALVLVQAAPAGASTQRIELEVTSGSVAWGYAYGDAPKGTWTFTVSAASPKANQVAIQLYRGNACGNSEAEIGRTFVEGPTTAPATVTIDSPYDGRHCVRVRLWGKRGATASVDVTPPACTLQAALADVCTFETP